MRWAPSATSAWRPCSTWCEVREEGGPFARHLRLPRAGRSAAGQQARAGEPGPGRRLRQHPPEPRASCSTAADMLMAYGQSVAAERASSQVSLFGGDQAGGRAAAPGQRSSPGSARSSWTRSWRRSASTCPATRWRTWSRRCAASASTFCAEAMALAEAGARGLPHGRRGAPHAGAGQRPDGREVRLRHLLRPHRRVRGAVPAGAAAPLPRGAGAGRRGAGQGARQGARTARCASSATTPSRSRQPSSRRSLGLRVHVSPRAAELEALQRAAGAAPSATRGGEVVAGRLAGRPAARWR